MIKASSVIVEKGYITVKVEDGRIISIPLEWYKELKEATSEQLLEFQLIGRGTIIEWEELDIHMGVAEMFTVEQKEKVA